MDRERFPTVASYLERLPRGVASYPECSVKASVFRDALESRALSAEDLSGLPHEVAELVERPPPVVTWIPDVQCLVILTAIRDRHFPSGQAGLEAYSNWMYERNRRLLTRPLYRALFLLVSPERLLRGVDRRWGAFRRGTSLSLVAQGTGWAELLARHPPHLFNESTHYGICGAFRAATEASGGRQVHTETREVKAHEARYVLTWQKR